MLTPGQAHDLACAEPLIDSADPEALIGDKAYDADPLINTLNRREITPVIPPVRRQRSLDRTGGLKKGEILAHRNVHRSEDETANSTIEGFG